MLLMKKTHLGTYKSVKKKIAKGMPAREAIGMTGAAQNRHQAFHFELQREIAKIVKKDRRFYRQHFT